MTGIGAIVAGSGSSSGSTPPISTTLSWAAANPYSVAGATGLSADIFNYKASGGVPPYTLAVVVATNVSGKLGMSAITNTSGDGTFHMTYTGFILSETESVTYRLNVTDSVGGTAARVYTLSVQRTS
jgi:hypothetical protein